MAALKSFGSRHCGRSSEEPFTNAWLNNDTDLIEVFAHDLDCAQRGVCDHQDEWKNAVRDAEAVRRHRDYGRLMSAVRVRDRAHRYRQAHGACVR